MTRGVFLLTLARAAFLLTLPCVVVWSHRKNDTAPAPELLVFVSVALASELCFFHGSSSGFWSFSHINILL